MDDRTSATNKKRLGEGPSAWKAKKDVNWFIYSCPMENRVTPRPVGRFKRQDRGYPGREKGDK